MEIGLACLVPTVLYQCCILLQQWLVERSADMRLAIFTKCQKSITELCEPSLPSVGGVQGIRHLCRLIMTSFHTPHRLIHGKALHLFYEASRGESQ